MTGIGDEVELQYQIDMDLLLRLKLFLVDYDIPHVYLSYRRMFADPLYLFDVLAPVLRPHDVPYAEFSAAYAALAAGS